VAAAWPAKEATCDLKMSVVQSARRLRLALLMPAVMLAFSEASMGFIQVACIGSRGKLQEDSMCQSSLPIKKENAVFL
jgi:hypothetical protein